MLLLHVAVPVVFRIGPVGPGRRRDGRDLVGLVVGPILVQIGRTACFFNEAGPITKRIERPILFF